MAMSSIQALVTFLVFCLHHDSTAMIAAEVTTSLGIAWRSMLGTLAQQKAQPAVNVICNVSCNVSGIHDKS